MNQVRLIPKTGCTHRPLNVQVRLKSEHFMDDPKKYFILLFYCFLPTLAYGLFFESHQIKNAT